MDFRMAMEILVVLMEQETLDLQLDQETLIHQDTHKMVDLDKQEDQNSDLIQDMVDQHQILAIQIMDDLVLPLKEETFDNKILVFRYHKCKNKK